MRAAVLTVSTSKARDEGEDDSGPRLTELLEDAGCEVVIQDLVPDDRRRIAAWLRETADGGGVELIATTGGTGLGPDDVTPEATGEVMEREAPGIAEALRLAAREHHPHWMLSRGVAGVRGSTLIVNFPGSPRSIVESGPALTGSLRHALDLLAGRGHGH